LAAHFAKRNTKFGGGGKRGRAKIPSPQPPSFLPARAFSLAREARRQFRSKKVRISSNKRTKLDFVIFCGGKQRFARRAERRGFIGAKSMGGTLCRPRSGSQKAV